MITLLTVIIGIFTARMFASLAVLKRWLPIPDNVMQAVAQMRKVFHVLYQFEFDSTQGRKKLAWFAANIEQVCLLHHTTIMCIHLLSCVGV